MKSYAYKHSETIQTYTMENRLYREEMLKQIDQEASEEMNLKQEEKQRIKVTIIKLANVMVYVFILLYLFGVETAVIFILPAAPLFAYFILLFIVRSKI